ncbi:MAG: hypothetical protein VR69_17575 [Peptococcaceae bacterium BRH_c4b]|nr:MAG: hypothetical protein VR69_17575 [Peptococcaceae bacterium BRH_c4b]
MLAVLCFMLGAWLLWVLAVVCREDDNSGRGEIVFLLGNHEDSVEILLRRLAREVRVEPVCYVMCADEKSKDRTGAIINLFCRSRLGTGLVSAREKGVGSPCHQIRPVKDNRRYFDLSDYCDKHVIALALYGELC